MAGPWEQYQKSSDGPWMQYAKATEPAAPTGEISRTEKVIKGFLDPIEGSAQLLTHILPNSVVNAGNKLNNWLADKTGLVAKIPEGGMDALVKQNEEAYQAKRTAAGESGFDGYRLIGNVTSPANLALAAKIPQGATMAGRVGIGMLGGGATALTNPITDGNFWDEKAFQGLAGAAFGGMLPAVTGGIARVISPKASTNAELNLLKASGVRPTIGQSLGGVANSMEEKAQSLPIVGDAIAAARNNAKEQFNNAAINRASAEIGVNVKGSGQDAVAAAGDALGAAYKKALDSVKVVKFDPQFATDVTRLKGMAQSLVPAMRSKFNSTLEDVLGGRMTGTGSMLGQTYKKVDSEIGGLAAKYSGSSVASEKELGDALLQLQSLLKQQVARSNPQAAQALQAADAGWANLVRVEGASTAAKATDGIFTPGQLLTAVRTADKSVRDRATARGQALMQDLATAGQNVLGNKVPDSGTAGRVGLGVAGVASGAISPWIPAGLLAGAGVYLPPMQSLLRGLVSSRPQAAEPIAEALRKASPLLIPGSAQMGLGLLN